MTEAESETESGMGRQAFSVLDARRARRVATEQRLLDAAAVLFGRDGYTRASVHDIAAHAKANVGLINRYFGGKRGLFLAVVERFVNHKQTVELDYPPCDTLEDEIRSYLLFRYREDRRQGALSATIVGEVAIDREFRREALSTLTYAADENFRKRLALLQDAGAIPETTDTIDLFRMIALFSFSSGFIEGEILGMPETETRDLIAEFSKRLSSVASRPPPVPKT